MLPSFCSQRDIWRDCRKCRAYKKKRQECSQILAGPFLLLIPGALYSGPAAMLPGPRPSAKLRNVIRADALMSGASTFYGEDVFTLIRFIVRYQGQIICEA